MRRIVTFAPLAAAVLAASVPVSGLTAEPAATADPGRLCFPDSGGVIELRISRAELSKPGVGLVPGRTYGPDRPGSGCFTRQPLPILAYYTTGGNGRIVVSLTQTIYGLGMSCAGTYSLSLQAPTLQGVMCQTDFDYVGCTRQPYGPIPCPRSAD